MKYKRCLDLENPNNTQKIILDELTKNSKVLDIGCAQGFLGECLNKELGCEVVGIDYLESYIYESKKRDSYKELLQIDLNFLADELNKYLGYFDYIILADVLEHLYNPKKLLKQIQKLLNSNGRIVISIPNISHGSILLNLINNRFKYTQTGLLDNTHIRFYDLYSFIDILSEENLEILSLNSSTAIPTETEQDVNIDSIPYSVIKFLGNKPHIYCYQYILKVKINQDTSQLNCINKEKVKEFNENLDKKLRVLKKRFTISPLIKFLKYPRKTISKILKTKI